MAALDAAEHFFTTRDPSEIGCLFYSRSLKKFVEPQPGDDVVPEYFVGMLFVMAVST